MITLPSPIAASDITHYIAQMVAQINAEIAAFGDAVGKLDAMKVSIDGMRSRLSQLESRMGALEKPAPAAKVEAKNG